MPVGASPRKLATSLHHQARFNCVHQPEVKTALAYYSESSRGMFQ